MPGEEERVAAGPALLAKRFDLSKKHDSLPISLENGLWLASQSSSDRMQKMVQTTRIGVSKAKDLPWRWYLQNSRSVSKRVKGDKVPKPLHSWKPIEEEGP